MRRSFSPSAWLPVDSEVDPVELAALTVVTAGVMNTPDAYSLR